MAQVRREVDMKLSRVIKLTTHVLSIVLGWMFLTVGFFGWENAYYYHPIRLKGWLMLSLVLLLGVVGWGLVWIVYWIVYFLLSWIIKGIRKGIGGGRVKR